LKPINGGYIVIKKKIYDNNSQ